jgi:hypothetical protein
LNRLIAGNKDLHMPVAGSSRILTYSQDYTALSKISMISSSFNRIGFPRMLLVF